MYPWTETLIRKLKQDQRYTLDKEIPYFDLIEILIYRGLAVVRGFWIRPW